MKKIILYCTLFTTSLLAAQTKQNFRITGDSNLSEIVKTETLKVKITGDGKFIGTGEAKNIIVRVTGDGVCDLSNVKGDNANIRIIGDGTVIINTKKLQSRIIGDGTIRTLGKPFVTKNFVIGDGRVLSTDDGL